MLESMFDHCSSICRHIAPTKEFKTVKHKLRSFPIVHRKEGDVHAFVYWDGQCRTCDGNTAHALEQIILNTIALYGDVD